MKKKSEEQRGKKPDLLGLVCQVFFFSFFVFFSICFSVFFILFIFYGIELVSWICCFLLTAPSTPRELKLTAKNDSVIVMSWIKPAMLNGGLSNILYRVNYIPQGGNVSDDLFIRHSSSGSPQNFTLVDLLPDTVYTVMVFAGRKRHDGVERWSRHVSETVKTWQIGEWNVERFIEVFLQSVGRMAHRFFRSFGWTKNNYCLWLETIDQEKIILVHAYGSRNFCG